MVVMSSTCNDTRKLLKISFRKEFHNTSQLHHCYWSIFDFVKQKYYYYYISRKVKYVSSIST